ncbi:MAG: lanthionine synthetase LanC family protein, partial [Planctomycetota bacterium]
AQRAGRRLIELGRPAGSGLKWAMSPTYDRLMPNFSHGTAGICYFLASLHRETGDAALLDAALAGARYLLSIARTDDDSCLIFHHEPGGEGLYYLGWCHGPAGTARLFYRLWEVTGDEKWLAQTRRCARAILVSGIPEARTPGFWNNVGLCCGSAGVAELFLGLHAASGESEHLRFARRVAGDLLTRGTRDDKGIRWLQAEHRVRPELVKVQTGAMQGAAGIGMLLLELHNLEAGRPAPMRFPDSPFPVELRRRD